MSEPRKKPSRTPSAAADLIYPVRRRIWLACVIQGIGAGLGVIPFIAIAEIGRLLLSDQGSGTAIWWVAGLAAFALFGRLICLMSVGAITHVADIDLQLHLRRRLTSHLSRLPLGWFGTKRSGQVKSALQDDIHGLHHIVGHAYTNIVGAAVFPVVALIYLFASDWRMALAALISPVLGIAVYSLQMRGYGDKVKAYNEALATLNADAVEFVNGISVAKIFAASGQAHERFETSTQHFMDMYRSLIRGTLAIASAAMTILSPIGALIFVAIVGLALVQTGSTTVADILPALALAPALPHPLMVISFAENDLNIAREAARRIKEILDTPIMSESEIGLQPKGTEVTFNNVSFFYTEKSEAVTNISVSLRPGTITALVGPSGSGKSTIAKLLPRFYDLSSGEITLGDAPINQLRNDDLYKRVGFVFQDSYLLNSSIFDNIALGKPGASQADVEQAAKLAQIHDRIAELPKGYETILGSDVHLSGGEAQRVSIARALLVDPPILVLDEATAFADPVAEAKIQTALNSLAHDRTLLIIAHRLETITDVDQIIVLEKGRIVQSGQHKQLIKDKDGLYASLWNAATPSQIETAK